MSKWSYFIVLVISFLPLISLSQPLSNSNATSQKRLALVIGNGNYSSSVLANPENDARAMKEALQNVGFTVMEYENLSQGKIKEVIDDFGMKLKNYDVGLFYYAGHGIQAKGFNYLIPVDAKIQNEPQVEYDCVRADRVLSLMETSGTIVNIIILDACRNNPFERSWNRSATSAGLAFMSAPKGTLIAYATAPGSTASDGSGKNGLYTSAILESMKIPDFTILQMFQNVRNIVALKSQNQQMPWESTSLTGDFYFHPVKIPAIEKKEKPLESIPIKTNSEVLPEVFSFPTVTIGNQIWMKENLRTDSFNDGTPIPLVTDNTVWSNTSSPAYCSYKNENINKVLYGTLYNWYAVNSGKLCPKGWHVPTDAEWTTLTTFLGGESIAGGKLKEQEKGNWLGSSNGIPVETEFKSLPGGYRYLAGNYFSLGSYGFWWSSTPSDASSAWSRNMSYNNNEVGSLSFNRSYGFSVRCLKD
ncbi:MAG: caspase family protein [Bacteroidales bacterium]|nr:caspase family protein [Bacteroidales bacterium]